MDELQSLDVGSYKSWNFRVLNARFFARYAQFGARTTRAHIGRIRQLLVDFKDDGWTVGLGEFDAIVTNQAVHELRHKKHATTLHRSVRTVLKPHGVYLACGHYLASDGTSNASLYMNIDEQRAALRTAGFTSVARLLEMKGLVAPGTALPMPPYPLALIAFHLHLPCPRPRTRRVTPQPC